MWTAFLAVITQKAMPSKATMEQIDSGYKATRRQAPKYTMRPKPEMVIGGSVPSWTNSIPGPKYACNADVFKPKHPVYSIRQKPEMVIGGGVPSWTNSIPGPKYMYDTDVIKPRQPVFTMGGRGEDEDKKLTRPQSAPSLTQCPTDAQIENGYKMTKQQPPKWSIYSRPAMVSGEAVPSWVRSVPGPKYKYDADVYKPRQPVFTIGKKLPTEGEIMSLRSPGPMRYGGAAMDSKKQELVDSTRKKTFSTSFGIGSRWDGPEAEMVKSGAWNRYARPVGRP